MVDRFVVTSHFPTSDNEHTEATAETFRLVRFESGVGRHAVITGAYRDLVDAVVLEADLRFGDPSNLDEAG